MGCARNMLFFMGRCTVKKSAVVVLLVLLAGAAWMLSSCATAPEKPEAAKPAAPAPAPAPEEAKPEPVAPPAEAAPIAVWQATDIAVTKDGGSVDLPRELTSYPVMVRVLDDTNLELVVGAGAEFSIPSTYTLTERSLVIRPKDYKNPPQVLIDTLSAMGVRRLPEAYYFTISTMADGKGVLEAAALGYEMRATWTQIEGMGKLIE